MACDKLIDEEDFFDFTATRYNYSSTSEWEDYVGCDTLTDGSAVIESFLERCSCSDVVYVYEPCYWVALLRPSDDICYAQGVRTSSSDGDVTFVSSNLYDPCWASNPPGSAGLTLTALAVALSSQLLEAFVGFKYWKASDKRTEAFTFAASVCEALGVVVVSSVLLTLPGFYGFSDYTNHLPVLLGLAWLTVTIVVAGALAEITAQYSSRADARFPYLGAVGNALVWLGAALLEIVVTSYLLWTGARLKNVVELVADAAVLFALELLALVAMWIARGLWTRAKILRSKVKALEGPLRKRVNSSPIG